MKIDEFCARYGGDVRSIDAVAQRWHIAEIDLLLCRLEADAVGEAVVFGDAVHGDGIRDQIPSELRDAFRGLMKGKADSLNEMREILRDKIRGDDGEFLSFRDPEVRNWVSKIKGQIGENLFKRHAGAAAELATSGSQEGWDVAVLQGDSTREYVQVKLYKNPIKVIQQMREVHDKLAIGKIQGVDGEIVERISFAVPEDIAAEVQRLSERCPELIDIKIRTVSITATAAGKIVEEGLNNVGPGELAHLFDELFCGTLAAASLHALANGFLWYKGAKDLSDAYADAVANTTLSAAGIGIGLLAETLSNSTPVSAAVAFGGRAVLSRFARSRWNFADFLEESIEFSETQVAALERLGNGEFPKNLAGTALPVVG